MNIIQYNYPTIYNKHVINANMLSKQTSKQNNIQTKTAEIIYICILVSFLPCAWSPLQKWIGMELKLPTVHLYKFDQVYI